MAKSALPVFSFPLLMHTSSTGSTPTARPPIPTPLSLVIMQHVRSQISDRYPPRRFHAHPPHIFAVDHEASIPYAHYALQRCAPHPRRSALDHSRVPQAKHLRSSVIVIVDRRPTTPSPRHQDSTLHPHLQHTSPFTRLTTQTPYLANMHDRVQTSTLKL